MLAEPSYRDFAEALGTKVAYLAIAVDLEGRKHALGCWIQDTEGAKFWRADSASRA